MVFPARIGRRRFRSGALRIRKLQPGDQVRATASSVTIRAAAGRSSLIWGRNHDTSTQHNNNSYLAESVVPVSRRDFITGRVELADKDGLVLCEQPDYRIGAYTLGYTRDIPLFSYVETGIGANFGFGSLPDAIKPLYGVHPVGGNIFCPIQIKEKLLITIFLALALADVTGVVTDTMCGAKHTMMKDQPDDKCVKMCVKGSSNYALYDGQNIFKLSDQSKPAKFAGSKLKSDRHAGPEAKTIKVSSIELAPGA